MCCLPNSRASYKFPTAFSPDTVGEFSFPNVETKGSQRSYVPNKIHCFLSVALKHQKQQNFSWEKTKHCSIFFLQGNWNILHKAWLQTLAPIWQIYYYFVTHWSTGQSVSFNITFYTLKTTKLFSFSYFEKHI